MWDVWMSQYVAGWDKTRTYFTFSLLLCNKKSLSADLVKLLVEFYW